MTVDRSVATEARMKILEAMQSLKTPTHQEPCQ
jgi:hypothetical protein